MPIAQPAAAKRASDVAPAILDTESVHINASTGDHQLAPPTPSAASAAAANGHNYVGSTPKNHASKSASASSAAVIEIPVETAESGDGLAGTVDTGNPGLRTIELSSGRVREGFGTYGGGSRNR